MKKLTFLFCLLILAACGGEDEDPKPVRPEVGTWVLATPANYGFVECEFTIFERNDSLKIRDAKAISINATMYNGVTAGIFENQEGIYVQMYVNGNDVDKVNLYKGVVRNDSLVAFVNVKHGTSGIDSFQDVPFLRK